MPPSTNTANQAEPGTSPLASQPLEQYGPLDDPCHCLSIVSSRGVSAYDVTALFRLVQERVLPQSYAALVLLREMTRQIDASQMKKIRKELHVEVLKDLLRDQLLQVRPTGQLQRRNVHRSSHMKS